MVQAPNPCVGLWTPAEPMRKGTEPVLSHQRQPFKDLSELIRKRQLMARRLSGPSPVALKSSCGERMLDTTPQLLQWMAWSEGLDLEITQRRES